MIVRDDAIMHDSFRFVVSCLVPILTQMPTTRAVRQTRRVVYVRALLHMMTACHDPTQRIGLSGMLSSNIKVLHAPLERQRGDIRRNVCDCTGTRG